MKTQYIFPAVLMFLMLCASAVYFYNGDLRRGIYWICGAVITLVVTW